jgi:hypothetical protein
VTTSNERRRLLDAYLAISVDTLERLIGTGALFEQERSLSE